VRPVMTPVPLTSTAGYYNTAMITAKTAGLLGHKEDARRYADLAGEIRVAFNRHFLNSETGEYAKYSQASQLLPLYLGLAPEELRPLVMDRLIAKIHASDDHVGTGFVATPFLLNGLSDMGLGELAYTMANQRTYPSWYDMVYNHGTKIFKEDWAGGAVQMPPLGGGLGWWFYYGLAGIRPDPEHPGFKHVIIRPDMVSALTYASGEYRSVYGWIRTAWKRESNRITLEIDIPANTTASVYLPVKDPVGVTESGKPVAGNGDFNPVREQDGLTVITIGSGHYSFELTQK